MNAPTHPENLIWALWTNNDDGRLVLTNREGEVFHLDPSESPHLAVALSNHCTDNAERSFVRSEWAEIDDDEDDE
jgi:hypothetical protein